MIKKGSCPNILILEHNGESNIYIINNYIQNSYVDIESNTFINLINNIINDLIDYNNNIDFSFLFDKKLINIINMLLYKDILDDTMIGKNQYKNSFLKEYLEELGFSNNKESFRKILIKDLLQYKNDILNLLDKHININPIISSNINIIIFNMSYNKYEKYYINKIKFCGHFGVYYYYEINSFFIKSLRCFNDFYYKNINNNKYLEFVLDNDGNYLLDLHNDLFGMFERSKNINYYDSIYDNDSMSIYFKKLITLFNLNINVLNDIFFTTKFENKKKIIFKELLNICKYFNKNSHNILYLNLKFKFLNLIKQKSNINDFIDNIINIRRCKINTLFNKDCIFNKIQGVNYLQFHNKSIYKLCYNILQSKFDEEDVKNIINLCN